MRVFQVTLGNGWESLGAKNQQHRQHIVNTVAGRPLGTSGILLDNLWRMADTEQQPNQPGC
jgi:hypothetical protein